MMKRLNLDRHQLWVIGGNRASQYLRGNCLSILPSTCRKPICLWLLEVVSYSCTLAAPAQDRALAGWPEPHTRSARLPVPLPKQLCSHPLCSARKEDPEFLHRCVAEGKNVHRMWICTLYLPYKRVNHKQGTCY